MDTLKKRWREMLIGNSGNNSDFSDKLRDIDAAAEKEFFAMHTNADAADLFESAPITQSAMMTAQYKRLFNMAFAYQTAGSRFYRDETLFGKLCFGLDWLYENRYGENQKKPGGWRDPSLHNWWDWQIGTPRTLIDILMLICDELSAEKISEYLSLFHYLVPKPSMTGSNYLNFCVELMGAAILENDEAALLRNIASLSPVFRYCDPSQDKCEGYYPDGSYLFHAHHAMNGTYGLEQLDLAAFLVSLFFGTKYALPKIYTDFAVNMFIKGQLPFVFRGGFMRGVLGRYPDGGKVNKVRLLRTAADLLPCLNGKARKKTVWVISELADSESLKQLSFSRQRKILSVVSKQKENDGGEFVFSHIDKIVCKREKWALSVAMNSERIAGYESINGCNTYGWYHGDGMTQIMLGSDNEQFKNGYWASVNPYKIPGVTADTQERVPVSAALEHDYISDESFAGGVSLGGVCCGAMRLSSFHCESGTDNFEPDKINTKQCNHGCTLKANKAWFIFDNAFAALGSGITASDGFEVETTVDNRRIFDRKIYKGSAYVNYGDMLGYVFPDGGELKQHVTDNGFFEIRLSHGVNPYGGKYSYIVLPGATARQTCEYAKTPDIEILANNENVQCVLQKSSGVQCFVFLKPCSFDGVSVSEPVILIRKKCGTGVEFAVCDPTHKLVSAEIEIDGVTVKNSRRVTAEKGKAVVSFCGCGGEGIRFGAYGQSGNHVL